VMQCAAVVRSEVALAEAMPVRTNFLAARVPVGPISSNSSQPAAFCTSQL
jgi:hypothetical protein